MGEGRRKRKDRAAAAAAQLSSARRAAASGRPASAPARAARHPPLSSRPPCAPDSALPPSLARAAARAVLFISAARKAAPALVLVALGAGAGAGAEAGVNSGQRRPVVVGKRGGNGRFFSPLAGPASASEIRSAAHPAGDLAVPAVLPPFRATIGWCACPLSQPWYRAQAILPLKYFAKFFEFRCYSIFIVIWQILSNGSSLSS